MRKYFLKITSIVFLLNSVCFTQLDTLSNYFPLQVGNYWQYEVSHIIFDDTTFLGYDFMEVLKDTIVDNNSYFKIKFIPRWFYHFFDDDSISVLRYDTLQNLILQYDFIFENAEYTLFNFNEPNGIDTLFVFGSYKSVMSFIEAGGGFQIFTYRFAKDIGPIFYRDDESTIGRDWLIFNLVYAKIDSVEYGKPVSINNYKEIFPSNYYLSQNYPNPFNPSTTIKYQISELSFVTLKVYDVLGNEIKTLVVEEQPIGSYEIEFDSNNLPSGIYFYRLQADAFVDTKKMVLLR